MNKKYLIMTVLAGFGTVQTHAVSQQEGEKDKKSDQSAVSVLQKLIDFYNAMLPKIANHRFHLHNAIDYMKQEESLMEKEDFLTRQELDKVNQMREDTQKADKKASAIANALQVDCYNQSACLSRDRDRMMENCQTKREKDLIKKVQTGIHMLKACCRYLGGYKGDQRFEGLDETKDKVWWNAHTRFYEEIKGMVETMEAVRTQTGGGEIVKDTRKEWDKIVDLQKKGLALKENQAQEPHNEQDLQRSLDQVKCELQDLQKRLKMLKKIKATRLSTQRAGLTEDGRAQMKMDDDYMNDLDVKLQKRLQELKEQKDLQQKQELEAEKSANNLRQELEEEKSAQKKKEKKHNLKKAVRLPVAKAEKGTIDEQRCADVNEAFISLPDMTAAKGMINYQDRVEEQNWVQPQNPCLFLPLKSLSVEFGQAQQKLQELEAEKSANNLRQELEEEKSAQKKKEKKHNLKKAVRLPVAKAEKGTIDEQRCADVNEAFISLPDMTAAKGMINYQDRVEEQNWVQPQNPCLFLPLKSLSVEFGQAQQKLQDLQRKQGGKESGINTHGDGTSFSRVKEESGRINKQRGQNTNYSAPAEEESKESSSLNTATVNVFCDSHSVFFTDQSFVSSSNGPKEGGGEKMMEQEQDSRLQKMVDDLLNDNTQ
jgi:hypothetical protein